MKKLQTIGKILIFIFVLGVIGVCAFDNLPTSAISVGVVATEIVPANDKRNWMTLYNLGSATVYIDNFSVDCSTITSFDLLSSKSITFDNYRGAIWGMVDVTTGTVKVIYTQY